jgi:hypothetical protein
MTRRLMVGIAVVLAVSWTIACSKKYTPPAAPTEVPTAAVPPPATSPSVPVDHFLGDWSADPLTDPAEIAAAAAAAGHSCSDVEFRAVLDAEAGTAVVGFAATCARLRVRAQGRGVISGNALVWRAEGTAAAPAGSTTCAARFVERNRAEPVATGQIKVTYNGTVCGTAVSGTALVRRR